MFEHEVHPFFQERGYAEPEEGMVEHDDVMFLLSARNSPFELYLIPENRRNFAVTVKLPLKA